MSLLFEQIQAEIEQAAIRAAAPVATLPPAERSPPADAQATPRTSASSAADAAPTPSDAITTPPLPANLPPPSPCPSCGRGEFWLTAYGGVVCCGCQPPSSPSLVRRLLRVATAACDLPCRWLDGAGLPPEIPGAEKKSPQLCSTCGGNNFWLTHDGEILCYSCQRQKDDTGKTVASGFSSLPPGKKIVVCGCGGSGLHWVSDDDFSHGRKTVREISLPQEIAYFDEMKKRAAEWAEKNAASASEAFDSYKGDRIRKSATRSRPKASESYGGRGRRR